MKKELINKLHEEFIKAFLYNHPPIDENYLKNSLKNVLEQGIKQDIIQPFYNIKKTKLPRKLKKKYKKEKRICFDIEYQEPINEIEFTIPIENNEVSQ